MQAYVATFEDCHDGPLQEVVWGANEADASEEACGFFGGDPDEIEIRRAPEFDACWGKTYSTLLEAMLANGWSFTGCAYYHCQRPIGDDEDYADDDGENGYCPDREPVVRGTHVFCSEWCAGADAVWHVERRIQSWEFAEQVIAALGPDIEVTSADGYTTAGPAVHFRFPGAKYEAGWDPFEKSAYVPNGDHEAWFAWRRQVKERNGTPG